MYIELHEQKGILQCFRREIEKKNCDNHVKK
jgi:hypothetical protein